MPRFTFLFFLNLILFSSLWANETILNDRMLMLDSMVIESPSCAGQSNGNIQVFVSGGTLPYHYQWNTGNSLDTFPVLTNLNSGTYTVTISDADGIALVETATLQEGLLIGLVALEIDSVSCDWKCDGSASVCAIDANTNEKIQANFLWKSGMLTLGDTISHADSLCRGWQAVTITDGEICGIVDSVFIPFPEPFFIHPSQTFATPVTCYGAEDGSVTIQGAGGVPPYIYEWQDGVFGNFRINLDEGVYSVVMTDAEGCTFTHSIDVAEPDSLSLFVEDATSVDCYDEQTGEIILGYEGGNALEGHPFLWSFGVITAEPFYDNLSAGTYAITLTDILGCSDTTSYVIDSPSALRADISYPEQDICSLAPIPITVENITGGNGAPYSFSINNEDTFYPTGTPVSSELNDINGVVTLKDGLGCEFDTMFAAPDFFQQITVFLPDVIEIEFGDSLRINPALVHDFPLSDIIWTPTEGLSCTDCETPYMKPTQTTLYTLMITDINGCTASGQVQVIVDDTFPYFLSKAFSPDQDGFNDYFNIFFGGPATATRLDMEFAIFSEWGVLLFHYSDKVPQRITWDGTHNGKNLPEGTYYYVLSIPEKGIDDKGAITLLRAQN